MKDENQTNLPGSVVIVPKLSNFGFMLLNIFEEIHDSIFNAYLKKKIIK